MPKGAILGRVVLAGAIECLTGLHIGAEGKSTEIGGLDAPVVRDPLIMEPYIPGSSLKGKLRSIAERREYVRRGCGDPREFFNKEIRQGEVAHHECDYEKCLPCRIFGVSKSGRAVTVNRPARVIVRDGGLLNPEKLKGAGTGLWTEIKMENSLDRISSAASPRSIERVLKGAVFAFEMVYTVEAPEELEEDLREILACLRLLEDDYLGGSGSRGYGKVKFEKMALEFRGRRYYTGESEAVVLAWGGLADLEKAVGSVGALDLQAG